MKTSDEFVECKLKTGQQPIHVLWSNPDVDVTLTQEYKLIQKAVYDAYKGVLELKQQPKGDK